MQTAKLQQYRDRLIEQRRELVQKRERALEAIPEEVHPPGENEIAPSEGLDIEMSLDHEDAQHLRQIDAALQLIKDGTFGKCTRCGHEIAESRLQALPSALYCVGCAQAAEQA